jgi:peptidoglycan/xylan/chitin deacetylase (PgdA/CDA1 family)
MKRFRVITAILAGAIFLILIGPSMEALRPVLLIFVLSLYGVLLFYGASQIDSQFFLHALCRGDTSGKKVAITFDDGPCEKNSEKILEILDKHHCSSTFFLIGNRVKANPELVEMMSKGGHLIGNHSLSHSNFFPFFRSSRIQKEVEECNRFLEAAGSGPVRFFRPPFGVTNPNVARGLKSTGMQVAGWSIRSFDTRNQAPEKVVKRILKRIKGGEVILLHESSEHILEILGQLLPAIAEAGLECVTLDQMFE